MSNPFDLNVLPRVGMKTKDNQQERIAKSEYKGRYMSVKQVVDRVGVSRQWVALWCKQKGFMKLGGYYLIPIEEGLAFAKRPHTGPKKGQKRKRTPISSMAKIYEQIRKEQGLK